MQVNRNLVGFAAAILTLGLSTVTSTSVQAQLIRAPLDSGFKRTSSIVMTVDEMLGSQKGRLPGEPLLGPGFPDLWIAEVQFKPVRYRRMEVTDLKSGEKNLELVWYMVYRVIPRDFIELAGVDGRDNLLKKLSDTNQLPQNSIDAMQRYSLQIPKFTLRTDDSATPVMYMDEVNLEIQREVLVREFQRRAPDLKLLNSIQGITEVVDPVSVDDPDQLSNAFYGVAIWRNVDPRTDYLTVRMEGFCNAYRISQNAAGETIVEHKVIEQRFGRPGDEYNQQEDEFRIVDEARMAPNGDITIVTETSESTFQNGRPVPPFVDTLRQQIQDKVANGGAPELSWPSWSYQPRPAAIKVPDFDKVLRNARIQVQAAPTP